jgi:hypothetical protein
VTNGAPVRSERSAKRRYQPPQFKRVGTLKALTAQPKGTTSIMENPPPQICRFPEKLFPSGIC